MYPEVRCDDLFVEATEEGLIICDLERHQIHALNGPASQIFRSSDGKTPLGDYPQLAPDLHDPRANVAVVEYGLHRLSQKRLLTAPFTSHLTRRQLLASVRALGVASAPFILPVISTIVAPTPLSAQSTVASCIGNPGACLTGPIATSEICAALGVPGCGSGNPGDIATPRSRFLARRTVLVHHLISRSPRYAARRSRPPSAQGDRALLETPLDVREPRDSTIHFSRASELLASRSPSGDRDHSDASCPTPFAVASGNRKS